MKSIPELKKLANVTKTKDLQIWAEMARRKKQFHPTEHWTKIKLWGLFAWGYVSHLLKSGEMTTTYKKENKTIWTLPTPEAYEKHIKPLLSLSIEDLTNISGW